MTSATTLGYVLRLRDQGWRGLLPILPADAKPAPWLSPDEEAVLRGRGKAPGQYEGNGYWSLLKGWRTCPDDEAMLERWAAWPGVNVGLRACHDGSEIVGLDLDILDPETAQEIGRLVRDFLHRHTGCGLGVAFRVGLWPKTLIPILVRGTVRKTSGQAYEVNGQKCAVEVLGEGSQFLIRGRHPAGTDYRWPLDGPEDIDPASLPSLSATELAELLDKIDVEFRRRGTPVGRARATVRTGTSASKDLEELRAWDREQALSAARALKNDDLEYHEWIQRAYALRGALGDEGEELWLALSRKSRKHRAGEARGVWRAVTQAEERGQLRSGVSGLYELAEADGWEAPPHPAQGLIDKIKAKHRAEVEARAQPRKDADGEPETDIATGAEREEEQPQADDLLPDFGPVREKRDAALLEMQQDIADTIAAADRRIALRLALAEAEREAGNDAEHVFREELDDYAAKLDRAQRRALKKRQESAAEEARRSFLVAHGLEDLPKAEAVLFHGVQGGGKTLAMAKALAQIERGSVTVFVPTLDKAEELKAEIERHDPCLPVFAWRGRTAPHPWAGDTIRFMGTDIPQPQRMCERDKEFITKIQAQHIEMRKTVCKDCPFRGGCAYLEQMAALEQTEGNRIIIAAREGMFISFGGFRSDLVIADEEVISLVPREGEIDPQFLVDDKLWAEARFHERYHLSTVYHAMQEPGRELAILRGACVKPEDLKAPACFLRGKHNEKLGEILEAIENGTGDEWLIQALRELEAAGYQKKARLFDNLMAELKTSRHGTNATRLVHREKKVEAPDGTMTREHLARYVVNWRRRPIVSEDTELVLLDGTGSPELNRLVFGEHVQDRRYAVQRRGVCIQVTSNTNSKYRLLHRLGAEKYRQRIHSLVRILHSVYKNELLVGCTLEIERKLIEEGTLDGILSMHFGAERGMNSAERCRVVVVIGREQPSIQVIEGMARAFMVEDERPFASILDQNERGKFPTFKRRRRMRDGSEAWGEVRSHPDPVVRTFLELIREASIVQMADRIRAVWAPKTIIVATDVPVDLDVDQLVTESELLIAVRAAADAVREVGAKGWHIQRKLVSGAQICNSILLQNPDPLTSFPAILPTANGWGTDAELWTRLSKAEAFRLAAAEHPGIREPAPEGGVLAECWRRYGIVPAWPDLLTLLPEFVPDDAALRAVKDAEREEMARLKTELPTVRYRVPGRRGPAGTATYDPSLVADIGRALVTLLGDGVTVEQPPETRAAPDFMDPNTWAPPAQGVIFDDGETPPFGFRGAPVQPPAYVIAGLFKIGDRPFVDVVCQPPSSSAKEAAA